MKKDAFHYLDRVEQNGQELSEELARSIEQRTIKMIPVNLGIYVFEFADGSGIVWYRAGDDYSPFSNLKNFWQIWEMGEKCSA